MKLRAPFNYDVDSASLEAATIIEGPSMTDQSFKDEVDINTIVQRFGLTGEMPSDLRMPSYGDFEATVDYHGAMLALKAADEEFLRLPGEIRARFDHNAGALIAFLEDPKNEEEARKLGILNPRKEAPAEPPKD